VRISTLCSLLDLDSRTSDSRANRNLCFDRQVLRRKPSQPSAAQGGEHQAQRGAMLARERPSPAITAAFEGGPRRELGKSASAMAERGDPAQNARAGARPLLI